MEIGDKSKPNGPPFSSSTFARSSSLLLTAAGSVESLEHCKAIFNRAQFEPSSSSQISLRLQALNQRFFFSEPTTNSRPSRTRPNSHLPLVGWKRCNRTWSFSDDAATSLSCFRRSWTLKQSCIDFPPQSRRASYNPPREFRDSIY